MGRIVVGIDGSPESVAALSWAADEALRRDAELVVVHAYRPPAEYASATLTAGYTLDPGAVHVAAAEEQRVRQQRYEAARGHAAGLLADCLRAADVPLDHLEISTQAVPDERPARVLANAARRADLLVVGTRGLGPVVGMVLGSVSQQCLHDAACPVVVIRNGKPA